MQDTQCGAVWRVYAKSALAAVRTWVEEINASVPARKALLRSHELGVERGPAEVNAVSHRLVVLDVAPAAALRLHDELPVDRVDG